MTSRNEGLNSKTENREKSSQLVGYKHIKFEFVIVLDRCVRKYIPYHTIYIFLSFAIILGVGTDLHGMKRPGSPSPSDMEVIRQRVVDDLLENPVEDDRIPDIVEDLNSDGFWPDIDYVDTSRTGFEHARHLSRMVSMSRAYNQESSDFYLGEDVEAAISRSLNYWLDHDFICENWWWNQIGTTRAMVNVLLLMQDQMTNDQITRAVEIVNRSNLEASGARPSGDRIKMAGILAKKLLVLQDEEEFEEVIGVIEGEIEFSEGRGMQVDYSFHHRLDRVNNTLSYGLGYARAFAEWAALVAGTRFEFGEPAIQQLVDYFLDGICKMAVHGKYPDPGAKNRSVSREGTLRAYGTEMIENLLTTTSYREEELKEIQAIRKGEQSNNRSFNKFFWQSEYMSHQRPDYFTSVRMYSTRNQNMEFPYNSEGLKNHYLGDGANFISRTGREYYDIFPVWDWRRIPGTTVVQKPDMPPAADVREKGLTDFVGGVSDGTNGVAAFDYLKKRDSLRARKSWFFFDDLWMCLGAGIQSASVFPVNTTINQSLLHGQVYVSSPSEMYHIRPQQQIKKKDMEWVWHDSVGYIFPTTAEVYVSNMSQSGSWRDINQQSDSPRDMVTQPIFKLWIDHGAQVQDGHYAYFVVPDVSTTDMEGEEYKDYIKILSNTPAIQAVQHRLQGMVEAVFYESGALTISNKMVIKMEDPGLIMVRYRNGKVLSMVVSDPSRNLSELNFSVSQELSGASVKADAEVKWNPELLQTEFTVVLPQNQWAGSSVVLDFQE